MLPDRSSTRTPFLSSYKPARLVVDGNDIIGFAPRSTYVPAQTPTHPMYISLLNMDSTFSYHDFADSYSRSTRSRASSRVSTTEALLQNLQLAEAPSVDTGSYTNSRPTSSRRLASPAYLSPSLSHSSGFLSTPLSQHQQPFQPPLPSEGGAVADPAWFEAEQSRAPGTPLLRLETASDQPGAPAASPPLASVEAESMRYIRPIRPSVPSRFTVASC